MSFFYIGFHYCNALSAPLTPVRAEPDEVADVIAQLKDAAKEVVAEAASADPLSQKIYDSYMAFLADVKAYHAISEQAYINAR